MFLPGSPLLYSPIHKPASHISVWSTVVWMESKAKVSPLLQHHPYTPSIIAFIGLEHDHLPDQAPLSIWFKPVMPFTRPWMTCGMYVWVSSCQSPSVGGSWSMSQDCLAWPNLVDLCFHCWLHISLQAVPGPLPPSSHKEEGAPEGPPLHLLQLSSSPLLQPYGLIPVTHWAPSCWHCIYPFATKLLGHRSTWYDLV